MASKGGKQDNNFKTLPQDKAGNSKPSSEASSGRSAPCPVPGDTCGFCGTRWFCFKCERTEGPGRARGAGPSRGLVGPLGGPGGHRARNVHSRKPAMHGASRRSAWEDSLSRWKSVMLTTGGCLCDIHYQLMLILEEVVLGPSQEDLCVSCKDHTSRVHCR